jgi:glycine cleavage system regulatory protein
MQHSLVMTVIGPDRPGLVESIASAVSQHGGNWLESRMSHLGGQFAGILRIEFPAEKEAAIMASLNALETQRLSVVIHLDMSPLKREDKPASTIEIVGHDRPGIVREISRVLAGHNVNVEEFSSEVVSAAMSGEAIFKAKAKLRLPNPALIESLRQDLEKLENDLIVDIQFQS